MKPRSFESQNLVYRGPTPDVGDLPCERVTPGLIRSVWELTPEERMAIAEGADIELLIHTEPIPPVRLAVYGEPKPVGTRIVNGRPAPFQEG